jgi:hypothetical protein
MRNTDAWHIYFINQLREEQEKFMSTEDYKRGVEDAIKEIQENMPLPLSKQVDPADVLNEIPRYLRKKLLTKKVTKWVNIYNDDIGRAYHYPTEQQARENAATPANSTFTTGKVYLGTYPLEIEVPL